MKGLKSFTLAELLIVIIIIGILVSLAIVNYTGIRESSLNNEAMVSLKAIRATEIIHRMDKDAYYPSAGSVSNITAINQELKLSLPTASNRNWNYEVFSTGCSRATRNGGDSRSWYLTINDPDGQPDSGAGCP